MIRIKTMRAPVTAILLSLSLVIASDASAAPKRRAVTMPSMAMVNLTGDVRDSVTGQPVVMVEISAGSEVVRSDRTGKFTIAIPLSRPTTVTFARAGYATATSQLNLAASSTRTIQLTPTATVRVVTTASQTYELDEDTIEFGYAEPFLGVRRARVVKFCPAGGGEVEVDRDEFKRIDGPATTATEVACCPTTAALGITVELATGGPQRLYFTDSCRGLPMLLQGHDHRTWEVIYVRFTDVKEVVFP